MYNPFELIPKTIDPKLREILIYLIAIQLILFLILICYLIYEFVMYKLGYKKYEEQPVKEETSNENLIEEKDKKNQ